MKNNLIIWIIPFVLLVTSFFDINNYFRFSVYFLIIAQMSIFLFKLKIAKPTIKVFILIMIIIFSFVSLCAHFIMGFNILFNIFGLIMALSYFIFWSLYDPQIFNFKSYFKYLNVFYFIIGLIGVVQYFVSKDFFGYILTKEIEMTKDLDYIIFRATSITGSPQVYGLCLVIMSLINLNLYLFSNKFTNLIIFICFLFFASLSLNKSVGVLLILFLLLSFINMNKLKINHFIYFFLFLIVAIVFYEYILLYLFRFTSWDLLIISENRGRLSIYSYIISITNPLFGNGWGKFNSSVCKIFDEAYINPESFVFQIYGEAGVFVLFFMFMLFINFYKECNNFTKSIFLIFIGQLFFVHAILSPFIFPLCFLINPKLYNLEL